MRREQSTRSPIVPLSPEEVAQIRWQRGLKEFCAQATRPRPSPKRRLSPLHPARIHHVGEAFPFLSTHRRLAALAEPSDDFSVFVRDGTTAKFALFGDRLRKHTFAVAQCAVDVDA